MEPFAMALARCTEPLERGQTTTLQVNIGLVCNQACRHCHLEAGPRRTELMSQETIDEVVALARRISFRTIDITGGAPELNPGLPNLIERVALLAPRVVLRSNLTVLDSLDGGAQRELIQLCAAHRVVIVASLPATNPSQVDAQRGAGVLDRSVVALRALNELGYGAEGSGLELDLVSNPAGAFLPVPQEQAEERFRRDLLRKWGIVFNRLSTFANVPLGRFRRWLIESGNLEGYTQRLVAAFNPCALEGLMCRTLISVAWDGVLYDCDFNQALDLPMGGRRIDLRELQEAPPPGSPIAVSDHCYTCTAGAGFT